MILKAKSKFLIKNMHLEIKTTEIIGEGLKPLALYIVIIIRWSKVYSLAFLLALYHFINAQGHSPKMSAIFIQNQMHFI